MEDNNGDLENDFPLQMGNFIGSMLTSGGVQQLYVSSLFGQNPARVSELILACLVGTFGGGIGKSLRKCPSTYFLN